MDREMEITMARACIAELGKTEAGRSLLRRLLACEYADTVSVLDQLPKEDADGLTEALSVVYDKLMSSIDSGCKTS